MKKTLTLSVTVLLLTPSLAMAMVKPIFATLDQSTLSSTQTRYTAFERDGVTATNASLLNQASPAAIAGTVANLMVETSAAPGAGTSISFTLMKNGVATDLTCTVSDAGTTCEDTANSVSVAAGDVLEWRTVPINSPAIVNYALAATFESSAAGETAQWSTSRTNIGIGESDYHAVYGGSERGIYSDAYVVAPTDFTIDRLHFTTGDSATSGGDVTTVLLVNNATTSLTVTIPAGSTADYVGTDLTNSVDVNAGDTLALYTVNNSAQAETIRWGMRIRPDIDGESPLWAATTLISTAAVRYQSVQGQTSNGSADASADLKSPVAFTWRKTRAVINPANLAGDTWNLVTRINGVTGNQSLTWGEGLNGANDPSNSDSVFRGDWINFQTSPSGGPPSTTDVHLSSVAYINPGSTTPPPSLPYRVYNLGTMLLNGGSLIFN